MEAGSIVAAVEQQLEITMKAFTNKSYGRDHYFHAPKDHKVPKSSKDRRGAKSSKRQEHNMLIEQKLKLRMAY